MKILGLGINFKKFKSSNKERLASKLLNISLNIKLLRFLAVTSQLSHNGPHMSYRQGLVERLVKALLCHPSTYSWVHSVARNKRSCRWPHLVQNANIKKPVFNNKNKKFLMTYLKPQILSIKYNYFTSKFK